MSNKGHPWITDFAQIHSSNTLNTVSPGQHNWFEPASPNRACYFKAPDDCDPHRPHYPDSSVDLIDNKLYVHVNLVQLHGNSLIMSPKGEIGKEMPLPSKHTCNDIHPWVAVFEALKRLLRSVESYLSYFEHLHLSFLRSGAVIFYLSNHWAEMDILKNMKQFFGCFGRFCTVCECKHSESEQWIIMNLRSESVRKSSMINESRCN